ncbi:MAG: hypothetical protein Q4G19_00405 [Clostridia bacterium]|nr:hypothetical protein [Clostridia bacterium]
MEVRKHCSLLRLNQDLIQDIRNDTPDIRFMELLCAGKADEVAGLFREKKMFWDEPPVIDAPYERFEGLDGIRRFAAGFNGVFGAAVSSFTPVFQTRAGGRIALECVVSFVVNGMIEEVPMVVVTDLRTPKLLEEVRIYCHYSYVPGLQPYRKPIFRSAHLETGDPGLLTGAFKAYYEALHHAPYCDAERIRRAFAPDCIVGGYEPWDAPVRSREEMGKDAQEFGKHLSTYIPACVGMRYETLIDDGRTSVIEWVHVVSRQGAEKLNRVAMSAVSAYTKNDDGYLCSVRICDFPGHETEIDWSRTGITEAEAKAINRVEEFPAGCGNKPQLPLL